MGKGKTFLLFLLLAGIALLIFAPSLNRSFWSLLVLGELLDFDRPGWLTRLTPAPQIEEVTYPGASGPARGDLYLPPGGGKKGGILLCHGVIDTGKDDPRLKRFASVLCRAGFVVLVPDLQGMRSFRIAPTDIDEIQAGFSHLLSRGEIRPDSCGLFGFSYGAGPTLLAACRQEIRDRVRFAASFGGYYDLKNVLSFLATGHFEFAGKRYFRHPQEYGKWVFLANNLDLVGSEADRAVLRQILSVKLRDEKAPIERYLPLLGEEGRNIWDLLSHADPSKAESFLNRLPSSVRRTMGALSVSGALKDLRAALILAHGEDDDLIPFTETLRLAQAAPDPGKVYLRILKTFSHIDPEGRPWSAKNFFTFYLPEGWKLFGVVNRLMAHR